MKTILAFPADTHAGSTVGLIMPKAWQLDAGGTYHPSKVQRLIWKQWQECWETVKQMRQPGDRVIITVMGDAIDGKHHDTSELITQRVEEQERIFIDCLDWVLQCISFGNNDLLQFISGTPAHVGEMAQSERRIAKDFNTQLYDRKLFDIDGVKFDSAHDGLSVGKRMWTVKSSLSSILSSFIIECLAYNLDVPNYLIRAHRHQFLTHIAEVGLYKTTGLICPAFQNKTTYGERFTATRPKRPPDIGMLIIVVEDNGEHYWLCPRMQFPKEKYEAI